ncbi:hypothetical protein B0H13DRAFT_2338763 [Mycena leptocephala]|nr:hypothetical protein B0H13DRAFT_2338763 [Mycena leptocephala]
MDSSWPSSSPVSPRPRGDSSCGDGSPIFDSSPALDSYLIEFYHNIRPLLTIPSFDSAPLCVLYTNHLSAREIEQSRMIIEFRQRLMKDLVDWCRTLPADVAEMLKLNLQLDNTDLAIQLMEAHIFSMQSELIELKVWACLLLELVEFAGRRISYVQELNRRHSTESHLCFRPYIVVGMDVDPWFMENLVSAAPDPRARDNIVAGTSFTGVGWTTSTSYHLGSASHGDTTFASNAAISSRAGLVRRHSQRRHSLNSIIEM